MPEPNLTRFLDAHNQSYLKALAEIKTGIKTSHWMWYIFPQAQGLANSETARFYAINDLEEAQAFLHLYWKSIMMGRRMGGHWNSLPKSAINFIALFSS